MKGRCLQYITFFILFSDNTFEPYLHLSSSSSCCGIRCLFLLHGLMFGKSKSHSLRHLDVSSSAVFEAGSLRLFQSFGTKGTDTAVKASGDQVVVHTVWRCIVINHAGVPTKEIKTKERENFGEYSRLHTGYQWRSLYPGFFQSSS